MSEATHTPGPWFVLGSGGHWERSLSIRADGWGSVAHVGVDKSLPHWDEPQRANARLIAAAPDLLESLKTLIPILEEWHEAFQLDVGDKEAPALGRARAAIAKAAGNQHG